MRRGDVGALEVSDVGIHDRGRPSVTE
jgi:hypothetical protein